MGLTKKSIAEKETIRWLYLTKLVNKYPNISEHCVVGLLPSVLSHGGSYFEELCMFRYYLFLLRSDQ